jgi:two-component system OmpR family sensor kinase
VGRAPKSAAPQAEYALGRMESGIGRMRTLVADLLLLARLDAGRPPATPARPDPTTAGSS